MGFKINYKKKEEDLPSTKFFQKKFSAGFTLMELLVVIAVIGILASVIIASLNGARQRTRDSRRVSELREIDGAIRVYFQENFSIPTSIAGPTDLSSTIGEKNFGGLLPQDPNGGNYVYLVDSTNPKKYCIGANMETTITGSQGCTISGATGANYWITGL